MSNCKLQAELYSRLNYTTYQIDRWNGCDDDTDEKPLIGCTTKKTKEEKSEEEIAMNDYSKQLLDYCSISSRDKWAEWFVNGFHETSRLIEELKTKVECIKRKNNLVEIGCINNTLEELENILQELKKNQEISVRYLLERKSLSEKEKFTRERARLKNGALRERGKGKFFELTETEKTATTKKLTKNPKTTVLTEKSRKKKKGDLNIGNTLY